MKITLSVPAALVALPVVLLLALAGAAHAGLIGTGVELAQQAPAMSGDVLQEKIAGGLDADPAITSFSALSSVAWQSVTPTAQPAPSTSNYQLENAIQVFTVTNKDPTNVVCWTTTGRIDGDCSDDPVPNAGTVTCTGTGTSTDKSPVMPGTQRTFVYKGPKCLWVRSSAALVAYVEDVSR